MNKIELVVPAGGYEQLESAVLAGADSVYVGFEKYSARAYADNFDLKNLERASEYCHLNNVKLYLALNTIIKENELHGLADFISGILKKVRIDAFIIQDFALLKILNDLDCSVPVHASTQVNIHNSFSAEFLKNLGIKRIILSREMTLEEIKKIAEKDIADIEIFCHGSQCYSYSGQCYFSTSVGQRSGNRGTCPQPCRMKYKLIGNGNKCRSDQEGYFLSKCDLSLIDRLPEIINAGVKAIKIEGRMKTPEYVAIVTSIYRKYIDIFYKGSNYLVDRQDIFKLKQVFSRKLNNGYFSEKFPKEIISFRKSGSTGNLFGRISGIETGKEKKIMLVDSEMNLRKDDILEIWTKKGNERIKVKNFLTEDNNNKNTKKIKYRIETNRKIFFAVGDRVFKYFDKGLEEEAAEISARKNKPGHELSRNTKGLKNSNFPIDGKKDKNIKNDIIYNDIDKKNEIYRRISSIKIRNSVSLISCSPGNIKEIIQGIDSAGESAENGKGIRINLIYDLFNTDKKSYAENSKKSINEFIKLSSYAAKKNIVFYFLTPAIIHDDDLNDVSEAVNYLIGNNFYNFYISNYAFLKFFYDYCGKTEKIFNIILAHNFNIANSFNLYELLREKPDNICLKEVVFSPELTVEEVSNAVVDFYGKILKKNNELVLPLATLYSYGYFPLMSARVKYNFSGDNSGNLFLRDKKNYSFMIRSDFSENTIIYNSKKHNLVSETAILIQGLINGFLIDARLLKKGESIFALNSFLEAVRINRRIADDYFNVAGIMKAKKETEKLTLRLLESEYFKDFTKGHVSKRVI